LADASQLNILNIQETKIMISASPTPLQDLPASTPGETTPELRPWSTPCVQSLNDAALDTQGGSASSGTGGILEVLS
jgi:hypothetical protein